MSDLDKKFILVGGIGRSGTSILGKALASTRFTEFFYEPPVFMHLLEVFDCNDSSFDWKNFLETVLYKDLMKGALSGRSLNFNRNDISSVYNYKNEEEVKSRLESSFRQNQLSDLLNERTAVIKVLDAIYRFNKLQALLPVFKAVIILRNPIDTTRSILNKGWFSDQQLNASSPEPLRYTKYKNQRRYPAFIEENDYDQWDEYSEMERTAYYCKFHLDKFQDLISKGNVIFVRYEDFVENPHALFFQISNSLGLEKGLKTNDILDSIELKSDRDYNFAELFSKNEICLRCMDSYHKLLELIS